LLENLLTMLTPGLNPPNGLVVSVTGATGFDGSLNSEPATFALLARVTAPDFVD
jgi:hypothetical protein